MESFGITEDDLDFDIDVFPCNWPALRLFLAMQTQWRIGGTGTRTGLDYAALPVVERRIGVKKKDRSRLFDDLRVMENEVLSAWAEEERRRASQT